jgi:hypothetical protein
MFEDLASSPLSLLRFWIFQLYNKSQTQFFDIYNRWKCRFPRTSLILSILLSSVYRGHRVHTLVIGAFSVCASHKTIVFAACAMNPNWSAITQLYQRFSNLLQIMPTAVVSFTICIGMCVWTHFNGTYSGRSIGLRTSRGNV